MAPSLEYFDKVVLSMVPDSPAQNTFLNLYYRSKANIPNNSISTQQTGLIWASKAQAASSSSSSTSKYKISVDFGLQLR